MLNPIYYHGTHEPWTVYDIEEAIKRTGGREFTSAFDKLGLWLTDKKDFAKWYGKKVIKFDLELENPFVVLRQGDYQPFAEGLYMGDIADRTIPDADRKIIEKGIFEGLCAYWEDPKTREDFEKVDRIGHGAFGFGPKNAAKFYRTLELMRLGEDYENAYRRWLLNWDYWKAVKDRLLQRGHDAVLFSDSMIDIGLAKESKRKPHNVVVHLFPGSLRPVSGKGK